jgi:hypothetical protein
MVDIISGYGSQMIDSAIGEVLFLCVRQRHVGLPGRGNHLSQNYTVVNGKVIDGPSFFGANLAEVRNFVTTAVHP